MNRQKLVLLTVAGALAVATGSAAAQAPKPAAAPAQGAPAERARLVAPVRGVAQNPVDHPHGGGEGKSGQGNPHPVSPWGQKTKGYKTRRNKRTRVMIVRDRRQK